MWYKKAVIGLVIGQFALLSVFSQQEAPIKDSKAQDIDKNKSDLPKKDEEKKDQPKLSNEEKDNLKDWTKEKLLKEMAFTKNILSRKGLEQLQFKINLELFLNKQNEIYSELKNKKEIALIEEKFADIKKSYDSIKDSKNYDKFNNDLTKLGIQDPAITLEEYADFKESEEVIKRCKKELLEIEKRFEENKIKIESPPGRIGSGKSPLQTFEDMIRKGPPRAPGTDQEPKVRGVDSEKVFQRLFK
jgi:hypothetical protein